MYFAFIVFDLWFQSKAGRAKRETEFHRTDSDCTVRFIALAKEQLASVTNNWSHRTSFLLLMVNDRLQMVRVERIALPTSSFQARPSAADIHPEKINPGALETGSGHYFDRARSLPASGLHPGKM
jgi:hypothetical protein